LWITVVLSLLTVAGPVRASSLKYSIDGVGGEPKENIEAWLGAEPSSTEERSNFISSAQEQVTLSLEALGYYRPDITIVIEKEKSPWEMLVTVVLNEPVRIAGVDVQVLDEASDDEEFSRLLESLPFAPGDIFHHGVYEGLKKQLSAMGRQRGYFDGVLSESRVEVNAADSTANIKIRYDSGQRYRFGPLNLDESVMDLSWVDSVITFDEGELFNMALLQRMRSELQQTRFFSAVTVRPDLEQAIEGAVPVTVSVSPAKRHNFEFGVGFSTDTEERVSTTWRSPMLNRYGHSQETRLEFSSINPSGRFTYNIPLSHPVNDLLQLSLYLEDNEYGDLDSKQMGWRVRREIKRGSWIGSYSLRSLNEKWQVEKVHRDNEYLLPGVSFSHKSRSGSLVDPESGLHQVYYFEAGNKELGSDIDLQRLYSNFRFVTPLAPRQRLVARAEFGAVFISDEDRANLAPSLSFFAGGSQSIRGFSYQSIGNEILVTAPDGIERIIVTGGDRLVVASLEYQFYFTDTWRGAVFFDAGDAFDEGEFDAKYGAGFGVHYMSPVGAIRLELANSLSEDNPSWRFHINIGAEF
jgi:translocation and assembly module TamA